MKRERDVLMDEEKPGTDRDEGMGEVVHVRQAEERYGK